ncbi:MAG: hypothetical protein AB7R69_03130 [Candidatus Babeliales bacterium]
MKNHLLVFIMLFSTSVQCSWYNPWSSDSENKPLHLNSETRQKEAIKGKQPAALLGLHAQNKINADQTKDGLVQIINNNPYDPALPNYVKALIKHCEEKKFLGFTHKEKQCDWKNQLNPEAFEGVLYRILEKEEYIGKNEYEDFEKIIKNNDLPISNNITTKVINLANQYPDNSYIQKIYDLIEQKNTEKAS